MADCTAGRYDRGIPVLEKALVAVRAQLTEAGKPVEAKRLLVDAAAKTLELTKSEKANAEKALAAAQKDIPQRDKNLEEIAQSYAELTPQVEPMKAKVKAAQEQYFAMLPKREVADLDKLGELADDGGFPRAQFVDIDRGFAEGDARVRGFVGFGNHFGCMQQGF